MPRVKIELQPNLFNAIYLREMLTEQSRTQIAYGGSSSGKSKFIAQRLVIDLLNGGRNYLCTRNTGNTLRTSSFAEVTKVITEWGCQRLFSIRESDMDILCRNGYSAMFKGLDDVEKLKSITARKGVVTDVWVEEATEIAESDFNQLEKRLRGLVGSDIQKRITLSFNPILRSHWIYRRFFGGWTDSHRVRRHDGLFILKTTYRDNRFLAPDDIKALEETTDPYMRDVYRDGKWGVLGGVIFPKVEVRDIINDPVFGTFDMIRHGLDFGFTNDPTAYNSMYYHRASRTLYIFGEWNARGCTNDRIAEAIKPYVRNGDSVVCDSAEPKSIAELNGYGLSARGAQKGKDSVKHGIQWLQQQRIIIDPTLQATINDFQGYHWKKDKTGESLNIPSDAFSHHPDAVRYACEDLVFAAPEDSVFSAPSQVFAAQTEMAAL